MSSRIERNRANRARMIQRRQSQWRRTSGFTPVNNERHAKALTAMTAVAQITNPELSAADAQEEAFRNFRATLPSRDFKPADWRLRPSKNDSAVYRKAAVA